VKLAPGAALVLAVLPVLSLSACEQGNWKGWAYPDRSNLADSVEVGEFDTLAECRDFTLARLEKERRYDENDDPIQGDYECGYKCKPAEGLSANLCERTER